MDSTETRYNFYKKSFKGGAQAVATQPQESVAPESATQPQESAAPAQETATASATEPQDEGLNQINQKIPKVKVNFKISSLFGNLDQTLGSKQKINLDKLFFAQLFGATY